jgi:tRNA A37 threonylcarbamoyladenosine dehydratase
MMAHEQFCRTIRLVGPERFRRIKSAFVVVVGLGAVGSYAVEGLARACVGRLRLVDFDVVKPSNINRQLYALHSTVGRRKSEIARQRVQDIHPGCQLECLDAFVHVDTMELVLAGSPDLVVDAIDALNPKVELLSAAIGRGLPIVSSMGAAERTDPAAIRVGPLSASLNCYLARIVRKRLRRRQLPLNLTAVCSIEPVPEPFTGELAPEESEENWVRGRPREPLGSLPTLTGMFGLALANAALQTLVGGAFTDKTV